MKSLIILSFPLRGGLKGKGTLKREDGVEADGEDGGESKAGFEGLRGSILCNNGILTNILSYIEI